MCMSGYNTGKVRTFKAMKPRTKMERHLLELRKVLPCGMSERQRRYADGLLEEKTSVLVSVITAHGEWTVVRTFFCERMDDEAGNPVRTYDEVYENWVSDEGREWILSKSYDRSPFWFQWHKDSEWGVNRHNEHCSGYYVSEDVYSVYCNYICPGAVVSRKLRRNGWSTVARKCCRIDPVTLMKVLLTDNTAEWLVKIRQYDMLTHMVKYGGIKTMSLRHPSLVAALRICTRNGYYVKDASMYIDYIDLLDYFGKDVHNAHYVCPENLKEAHDRLFMRKVRIEMKKEHEQMIAKAKAYEESYRRFRGMFFGICFGDDDIRVTVIGSVAEMAEEGMLMHHCVFANGYYSKRRHPFSLILSAKDREGNRLETVEVSTRTWDVVQSRGVCNLPSEHHDRIVELVERNMNLLKQAV